MSNEKEIRRLVIKAFHINKVELSNKTKIDNKTLSIRENIIDDLMPQEKDYIKNIKINIVSPDNHDIEVNSIMDFSPIAAKVLGRTGEGITHVLTGVHVMLTGADEEGVQVAEFGSSEGVLQEQVVLGRAGTPSKGDVIIHVDVTLNKGMGAIRPGVNSAHRACDRIVQEIREQLKKLNGRFCDEKHEYLDKIKPGKKKVVIIKQVAGQGAMYDTMMFGKEPGGFEAARSIIDIGNVPIILSPNEFRDGALRAMH
jgi:D-proline reductase (dithiol)-stabilizing protein PrdD